MLRACLLLVALAAAVQAACLADQLSVYFSNSGAGSLSGVAPNSVTTVAKLPICAAAYTKDANGLYQTCCAIDSFNAIKTYGDKVSQAIEQINTAYNAKAFDTFKSKFDTSQLPPQYKQLYDTLISAFKNFADDFFPHYGQCLDGYRDYLEGVLCSLCRPDFFPEIANISNGVLTFRFNQNTCTSLVTACAPAIEDLRTFLIAVFQALDGLINFGTLIPTSTPTLTVDFLANVAGADLKEKVATWLCQMRLAGIQSIDLMELADAFSEIKAAIPTNGVKRETGNRLRQFAAKLAARQSANTANTYDGTYEPVAIGSTQNFVSSASGVVVSVALIAVAAIGVMLF